MMNAKYVHTNLVALDWRPLADFYIKVFGCIPVPPERNLAGPEIDALTNIAGATINGMHLRLPGQGENGPTLEVFQYEPEGTPFTPATNRPGFGHIAFLVDDVHAAKEEVLNSGGRPVGETVIITIANGAKVTVCYVTDPEGNILELQSWS
jgi:catechol 2,3-dioxygenase-like lactoylglutathione lyase family enzyme